jgi:molybdopterin-containing oxidoreductase family membrane subunit
LFSKYFPVIAIAEIKYVLKGAGESYKNEMSKLEEIKLDEFVEEMHHGHQDEGTIKVAHH